jgi:hypothetical protein
MDAFTQQYLETALWSSLEGLGDDSDDTCMDESHSLADISDATVKQAEADCARFQSENEADLEAFAFQYADDEEQAAHYFWLTRNGHGAGFKDDSGIEAVRKRLADAASAFGDCTLYIGDDGEIYN